jgi:antitoxin HigA-1
MEMFNPPHPGEIIREDCLKPLDLSVTAAAKWLGVSRVTLSELLNGHNGVTAEMAIRLEKAGWGTAESWLRNQVSYDLWQPRSERAASRSRSFRRRNPREHSPRSSCPDRLALDEVLLPVQLHDQHRR